MQVRISILEDNLKNIKIGQAATVNGTAFTKEGYDGTITYISPSARQQYSGTSSETVVDAIVTLSEKDDSLKPGLSAKAKIQVSDLVESIIVPYDYVMQDEENREYVYLYDNGIAVKRIIVTGREFYEGFQIESGLSAGDRVIQNPGDIKQEKEKVVLETEGAKANG
ncbi:hypothetical protein SDC9_191628 [bioreactor metagenome]|uniref:Uncharacterized protein n=1 Tax=bioreactor metagenome TaxID=1076179 RepID=A0A645HYH4_9ZZZZ